MTGLFRRGIDRFLMVLARTVLRAFFHRVEAVGRDRAPTDRPVLVVANHFYGFVDPVMLMHVFGRLPRFVAKSTLWDMLWLRPFLALAGMIPVHRPEDRSDPQQNVAAFAHCYGALARGALVGIFPEGTTHDDPAIRSVRTGAARIALGARRAGVSGLVILPTGLTFDDKIALRSGVLGMVGEPIDVDAVATELGGGSPVDETDRPAVRALTARITEGLREVAPDYADAREAAVLRRAAEVTLQAGRGPNAEVSMAERELLARQLADAPVEARREIADRLAHYLLDLDLAQLRDHQVARQQTPRDLLLRTIVATVRLVVLAPLALLGTVWNLVPYWTVKTVGRLVASPVTKGTARITAALVAFPLMWTTVILLDPWDGILAGLVVLLLAPLSGLVAVSWSETLVRVHRDWRGWVTLTERRALLPGIRAARAAVADAVGRARQEQRTAA